jgi:hypothetical protein
MFFNIIGQFSSGSSNKARTGRLGLYTFFGLVLELWHFSVSERFSLQPYPGGA